MLARAEAEFTPPQVQELIGEYSPEGVRKALRRLVVQGIVLDRAAGNARLYRLNRAHIAAGPVMQLATLREALLALVRERIGAWQMPPTYAALFGSAARGQMHPGSDIDVFVVRPDAVDADDTGWRDQLDALSTDLSQWAGNDARILEYNHTEVVEGLRSGERVLADIVQDGVPLYGPVRYLRDARRRSA